MVLYEENILEIPYQMMSLDIKMEGEAGAEGVRGGGGMWGEEACSNLSLNVS